ncbi:Type 4 fimbrial biogenesis protein PilW [Desulfurella amilsii]|uniref:Type 4 fimbrial biogenesis protein PilW n=1 Tax=Desulfurella amilsii TaxID=1562698 RepID=A0A1X4XZM6_9BACT|nr:prepilin-type N-terminal cleavage/methylation domain-containing protein [Desulfurella amilsii]OSS42978.1 Type 4 fimbrial biogenesis protein PilW [Desulfurella amilsii]
MSDREKGFTLIEVIVTLFILMVALAIGYYTFVRVLKLSFYHSSTTKSQINTLMGTTLLRYDCEMAGYGLTQSIPNTVDSSNYNEAVSSPAKTYNVAPGVPWPYQIGTYNNASYLVIRSCLANINSASKKWSIMYYDGSSWQIQGYTDQLAWPAAESDYHFRPGSDDNDYVIILNKRDLYAKSSGLYYFKLSTLPSNANIPPSDYTYIVYGVSPDTTLRMPFNRVDYFLDNTNLPKFCEPSTYELYRTTINQANGGMNKQPLLDCVAKFQVAIKSNGQWFTSKNPFGSVIDSQNTQEVRIFIIQQSGKFNPEYTNANTINLGDTDTGTLSSFTPAGNQVHYQWKTIKLSIVPRNLVQ